MKIRAGFFSKSIRMKSVFFIVRSIRYAKEIKGLDCIIANDLSSKAVESIKKNIEGNKVENLVKASHNGQ